MLCIISDFTKDLSPYSRVRWLSSLGLNNDDVDKMTETRHWDNYSCVGFLAPQDTYHALINLM